MASRVISEAILTLAVLAMAITFAVTAFSSFQRLNNAYAYKSSSTDDILKTDIEIIFAANSSTTTIRIWIKNVGGSSISQNLISKSDLFFGPVENVSYIVYGGDTPPKWNYTICNDIDSDDTWDPGETIEILVTTSQTLDTGDYKVKFSTYNGVTDTYTFSL